MKRIRGWETSDGQSFDSREKAEKHEARISLRDWLIGATPSNGDQVSIDDVIEAMVSDARKLKSLLTPFAPIKRPRKKNPEIAEAAD